MKRWILLILLAGGSVVARAQVVADGATNTLSNITNTFTGDVTVGTNVQLSAAVWRAGEEHSGRGLLTLEKSFPSA